MVNSTEQSIYWTGKPYILKTIVKAVIIYVLFSLLLIWFLPLWLVSSIVYWLIILIYIYWKRAHTYYVRANSILITRDWIFGRYQREITYDKIQDVHIMQGLLARLMKCGSVVFVTTTGLEVGYTAVGVGKGIYGGVARPALQKGSWNTFLDVPFPEAVREIIMNKLVTWRETFQQQRIAAAVERLAQVPHGAVSIADELAKLKQLLDQGVITREEYEAAKKKLIG